MNLQPMSSGGCDASGRELTVYCVKCSARVGGKSALCDLDGKPGSYLCPRCGQLAEDDAYSRKVADFEQAQAERGAVGVEEGATCGRDGCEGEMVFEPVMDCACHIAPPCGACVENPLTCSSCGLGPGDEA